MDPQLFLDFAIPQLILAGNYASRIQTRVRTAPDKGGNIFQSVLTDADLSIQNFFEVALLAAFPDVRFFGEEHEKSLNTGYFPAAGDYTITLDPVNGTRLFVDQFDTFDIILCLTEKDHPLAAVTYLPRREIFYAAIRGKGAFVFTAAEAQRKTPWTALNIQREGKKLLTFKDPELFSLLSSRSIEAVDLIGAYTASPSSLTLNSIFTGELDGWVRRRAPLIDLGAVAFIAQEAGALATDFEGRPLPPYLRDEDYYVGEQVVACSAALHAAVLEALHNR